MLHSASSRNSEVSLESCFQARRQENAEENAVWLVLWVIPCVMAIPWIGLTPTDLIFLKTIMIVERTIVEAFSLHCIVSKSRLRMTQTSSSLRTSRVLAHGGQRLSARL